MNEKKRILLIDDDRDLVAANKEMLEANGYEVLTAPNGAKGLELARQTPPDLILLDVMMTTDTEGFSVSRTIHETPELQNVPVILMTGIREKMDLPFGVDPDETWLPVKTVLEKPVPAARLLAEIKKQLAMHN